jgi:DNA polymerase III alpha subunit (gram-positive type)
MKENKEQELGIENFLKLLPTKDKLEEFITSISQMEEHSILGICKYILEHQEEWQKVINEIQPFLKDYGLAYEDSFDLNIVGENFVINAIYYELWSEDTYEYRQAVGF